MKKVGSLENSELLYKNALTLGGIISEDHEIMKPLLEFLNKANLVRYN